MSLVSYSHHNISVWGKWYIKGEYRHLMLSEQERGDLAHGDTCVRFLVHSWNLKEKLANSKKGGCREKAIREVSPLYLWVLQPALNSELALSSATHSWALWVWFYPQSDCSGNFPTPMLPISPTIYSSFPTQPTWRLFPFIPSWATERSFPVWLSCFWDLTFLG